MKWWTSRWTEPRRTLSSIKEPSSHWKRSGELLAFCLNTTYFKYQGNFYKRVFREATASPFSPIFANMFMEVFEIKALATAPNLPCFWGWYIDDTGTVQKKHYVQGLFKHINSQHESIAFTVEEQDSKGYLPMLDVMWR